MELFVPRERRRTSTTPCRDGEQHVTNDYAVEYNAASTASRSLPNADGRALTRITGTGAAGADLDVDSVSCSTSAVR